MMLIESKCQLLDVPQIMTDMSSTSCAPDPHNSLQTYLASDVAPKGALKALSLSWIANSVESREEVKASTRVLGYPSCQSNITYIIHCILLTTVINETIEYTDFPKTIKHLLFQSSQL